jgi:raffinose/stachyose/melibiose transport system permease protein
MRNWRAHLILSAVSVVVVVPLVFLVFASFKSVSELFGSPFGLPKVFRVGNYSDAWHEAGLGQALRNSLVITVSAVVISTTLSCAAAYGIGCFRFFGRNTTRLLFVGGLLIPTQLIVFPLLVLYRDLGLLHTLIPMIATYSAFSIPLGVLVLVGFFETVPKELGEAAAIDGSRSWQIFVHVLLPLIRPAVVSVAILNGVWIWNDFFIPLVFSFSPHTGTLPLGILNFYGTYSTDWGLIFASVVLSVLPILVIYVFASRQLLGNLTAGAIKG